MSNLVATSRRTGTSRWVSRLPSWLEQAELYFRSDLSHPIGFGGNDNQCLERSLWIRCIEQSFEFAGCQIRFCWGRYAVVNLRCGCLRPGVAWNLRKGGFLLDTRGRNRLGVSYSRLRSLFLDRVLFVHRKGVQKPRKAPQGMPSQDSRCCQTQWQCCQHVAIGNIDRGFADYYQFS